MKITPRKYTLEDFKDQSWIGKLLSPLNSFIESVYALTQNNVSIEDNLFQEIKEIKFVNNAANFPLKFQTKFNKLPKSVLCIYCVATDGTTSSAQPWATWSYSNSQIQIDSLTSLTTDKTYIIRVHVIYG